MNQIINVALNTDTDRDTILRIDNALSAAYPETTINVGATDPAGMQVSILSADDRWLHANNNNGGDREACDILSEVEKLLVN